MKSKAITKKKFSSKADIKLLKAMHELAEIEGRKFQALLEEAMEEYIEAKKEQKVRSKVMSELRASLKKNKRLGELLA